MASRLCRGWRKFASLLGLNPVELWRSGQRSAAYKTRWAGRAPAAATGHSGVPGIYFIAPAPITIGTWSTQRLSTGPVALRGLNLVAYKRLLYAIGGRRRVQGQMNTVYQLHLAPSGEPTPPWTAVTIWPAAVQYTGAAACLKTSCSVYGGQSAAGTAET